MPVRWRIDMEEAGWGESCLKAKAVRVLEYRPYEPLRDELHIEFPGETVSYCLEDRDYWRVRGFPDVLRVKLMELGYHLVAYRESVRENVGNRVVWRLDLCLRPL